MVKPAKAYKITGAHLTAVAGNQHDAGSGQKNFPSRHVRRSAPTRGTLRRTLLRTQPPKKNRRGHADIHSADISHARHVVTRREEEDKIVLTPNFRRDACRRRSIRVAAVANIIMSRMPSAYDCNRACAGSYRG